MTHTHDQTTTPKAADELTVRDAIDICRQRFELRADMCWNGQADNDGREWKRFIGATFDALEKDIAQAPTLPVPVKEIEELYQKAFEDEEGHELPFHISDSRLYSGTIYDAKQMTVGTIFDPDMAQLALALLNAWPALRKLHGLAQAILAKPLSEHPEHDEYGFTECYTEGYNTALSECHKLARQLHAGAWRDATNGFDGAPLDGTPFLVWFVPKPESITPKPHRLTCRFKNHVLEYRHSHGWFTFYDGDYVVEGVTHWMPDIDPPTLPDAPTPPREGE